MSDYIELSDQTCPNCGHEAYERQCGCDRGYSGHDCGEDVCCCLYPEEDSVCVECQGRGYHCWCRRCGWDLLEKRFLNGHDERTPQELLEDRRSA
jgi:hypothetical protein